MPLYPYQKRVDASLRAGRSVILQAPTGTGKTRAALFPFLDAWRGDSAEFPRQCIYAVPMRVLANQFEAEYRQTVADYATRFGLLKNVAIQTGARSEDTRFAGDLVFTTLDQVLSSFLTIPYSLGNRLANLNAGAAVGSYLVFDEFHLFPVDEQGNGALATTLQLLKILKGVTPFVLMTATFSNTMLHQLAAELDAEAVTLTEQEIDAIPSQQGKQRRYRYTRQMLTAEAIAADFIERQPRRVIAVCNTVPRAQELLAALQDDKRLAGVQLELLHSRFYTRDRFIKEAAIRREFGEDRADYNDAPMILVATQVVEVGLNITCDVLHTELAPAAAVIQRAGRCARFAKERGDVLVYDVPLNTNGLPDFAPYLDPKPRGSTNEEETEGQSKLCERTQTAFASLPVEGSVLRYHDELQLVDQAHAPFDVRLLAQLHDNRHSLQADIEHVFATNDRTKARSLIRDIDNRTVVIHDNPNELSVPNPYRYEGIGIRRNTLLGWYARAQQQAMEQGLDWVVKIAVPQEEAALGEGPEQRRRIITVWQTLCPSTIKADIRAGASDIAGCSLLAVHPALVQYDQTLGLRLEPGTSHAPNSPQATKGAAKEDFGPLRRETYAEHITGLQRVYHDHLRDQTAAVRRRLEQLHGLEAGTIDRAIRLMFATHDLGKLDRQWQEWAHKWQDAVSNLRAQPERTIDAAYMAAHTDFDSRDERERRANSKIYPRRPPHAAESARAAYPLLRAIAGDCAALAVALMTAISCHHSSSLRAGHGPFAPVPGAAKTAFNEAMRCVGLIDDPMLRTAKARIDWSGFAAAEDLSDKLIRVDRTEQVILYLLLVRILRLADQGSQEH